jgi:inosine-uridine nucleoside N-ribohydrolase
VEFLLEQVRKYPGEITLIAIGPLMNVGAAIDKDAATFRKLKRVVVMGGSIRKGYGDLGYTPAVPPMPEWNLLNDVASAQKLFAAGVPLFVMPLDSTQLKLDEVKRAYLLSQGTALTDQLAVLYHLWRQERPTVFICSHDGCVCVASGVVSGTGNAYSRRRQGIHARGTRSVERASLSGFECRGIFQVLFEAGGGQVSTGSK